MTAPAFEVTTDVLHAYADGQLAAHERAAVDILDIHLWSFPLLSFVSYTPRQPALQGNYASLRIRSP